MSPTVKWMNETSPRNPHCCLLVGMLGCTLATQGLGHFGYDEVADTVWPILFFAHTMAALLFLLDGDDPSVPKRLPGRWAAILGTLAATFVCVHILSPDIFAFKGHYPSQHCADNLKHLGLVYRMYGDDRDDGRFPPLSAEAGHLMPATEDLFPQYLTDLTVMACDGRPRNGEEDTALAEALRDRSYFYLGYAIDRPEALRAFQKAYVEIVAAGGDFTADISVPEGQGTNGGDRLLRLRKLPEMGLSREDARRIPVLIERVGNHNRGGLDDIFGCNVYYLDGHVALRTYPREWPATPEAMQALHALDQLGPHIPPTIPANVPVLPLVALLGFVLFLVVGRSPSLWVVMTVVYLIVGVGFFGYCEPMPGEATVTLKDGREIVVPIHTDGLVQWRTPPW